MTAVAAVATAVLCSPAIAHPLGNDSVTHFSVIHVLPTRVEVDLVLDVAETVSAVLARDEIDSDGDGRDSVAEQEAWLSRKAEELASQLKLEVDGKVVALSAVDPDVEQANGGTNQRSRVIMKMPGFAGLSTYKIAIRYVGFYAEPLDADTHTLAYHDTSFPDYRGLMRVFLERTTLRCRMRDAERAAELIASLEPGPVKPKVREALAEGGIALSERCRVSDRGGQTWSITDGDKGYLVEADDEGMAVYDVPRVRILAPRPMFWDESEEDPFFYEQYDPTDLPEERQVSFKFRLEMLGARRADGDSGDRLTGYMDRLTDARNGASAKSEAHREADRLIGLLQQPWGFALFASITALCLAWGAAHALMPGHAKTLVAAYLISRHGTWRHAVVLAIVVTVTHTALVVIVGVILWAFQHSHPTLGPALQLWLGAIAGMLVAGMGAVLVWRAFSGRIGHHHHHDHGGHVHHHDHAHDHTHDHGHDHTHGHSHHDDHADEPITIRLLLVMGVTGGIVPCPTATIIMLLGIGANVVAGALYAVAVFSVGLALTPVSYTHLTLPTN